MTEQLLQESVRTEKRPNRLPKMFLAGFQDIMNTVLQHRIWLHLGWVEVKQRYRRSVIGPWWISLSMLIFIAMMGIVFSRLFHQSLEEYIPFFTAGYLFWIFISSTISESSEIFKSNGAFIKQISLPFSLYVFKHLVRQVIYLMHNAVVYLLVCVFFKINPGKSVFLVFPGLLLLIVNLYWISYLVALISARYRDMVQIISSCIQIAFFITPISWMPKLLSETSIVLKFNPLIYLLDTVRSPLLGTMPALSSYVISGCMAAGGIVISFVVFSMTRTRIAYWVD